MEKGRIGPAAALGTSAAHRHNHRPVPAESSSPPLPLIVLFDGECGLCNRAVDFLLRHDSGRRFRFASLQSAVGRDLLNKHGLDSEQINSVVLIDGERVYLKSNAVLRIALELPEPWPLAGSLVFVPQGLRDGVYDYVARHRKQWFKPDSSCRTPTEAERSQFLG